VRDTGVAEPEMEVVLRVELEHQRHAGRAARTARVLNPLAPARPATELVAGGGRGDRFRQLAPVVEQNKKKFVSALHQLNNECWAMILQKDNMLSCLIIDKASHIERFQEHAGKSIWDVIPHDA